MAVNPTPPRERQINGAESRLYLREEELDRAAELIQLAARKVFALAERALNEEGLHGAHYRALAAIRRSEGLSVGALIDTLGVRKQSLHRVLKDLVAAGHIARDHGPKDRRERRLTLTEKGRAAERAASAALRERLGAVFRAVGADAVAGTRLVLGALAEAGAGEDEEQGSEE